MWRSSRGIRIRQLATLPATRYALRTQVQLACWHNGAAPLPFTDHSSRLNLLSASPPNLCASAPVKPDWRARQFSRGCAAHMRWIRNEEMQMRFRSNTEPQRTQSLATSVCWLIAQSSLLRDILSQASQGAAGTEISEAGTVNREQ